MTTAVTKTDSIRLALGNPERIKMLQNYLGSAEDAKKFGSAVMYAIDTVPKLIDCTQESLIAAFMKCAELKIYPSSVSGEAFILPYNEKGVMKAQFQLGYQGIVTLLYRAGVKVNAQVVYQKDTFNYSEGFETILEHRPNMFEDRGEAIGAYAIAILPDGKRLCKVMSKSDIEKIKVMSKGAKSEYSPWNATASDPEKWMWKKTAVKQLAKLLPKTEELNQAIALDNEDTDFSLSKKEAMKATLSRPSESDVTALITGETPAVDETVTSDETGTTK